MIRGPKLIRLRAAAFLLLLTLGAFVASCRRSSPKETPEARQARRSSEYWQQAIGVTDQAQLQQIQALERRQSGRYRQFQGEIRKLRNQLKVRASQDRLTEAGRDSLVEAIARLTVAQERAGIEGWSEINRVLTPEQRQARIAGIQGSSQSPIPGAGGSAPDPGSDD